MTNLKKKLLTSISIRLVVITFVSVGVNYLTGLGILTSALFTVLVWVLSVKLNNSALPRWK